MICSAYTILWQLIISCIGLKCTLFVQPSFEALFLLPSFGSRSNSCRSGLGLFQVISAAVLFSALSSSPRLTCSQVCSRRGVEVIEELVSSPGRRVRGRDCFPCFPSRTFSHRLQSHCRGCHPPFWRLGRGSCSLLLPSNTISGCQTFPLLLLTESLLTHLHHA